MRAVTINFVETPISRFFRNLLIPLNYTIIYRYLGRGTDSRRRLDARGSSDQAQILRRPPAPLLGPNRGEGGFWRRRRRRRRRRSWGCTQNGMGTGLGGGGGVVGIGGIGIWTHLELEWVLGAIHTSPLSDICS